MLLPTSKKPYVFTGRISSSKVFGLVFFCQSSKLKGDKEIYTQCYIMTLKRTSKACGANQSFPFPTEKIGIFVNYSADFIFSLL